MAGNWKDHPTFCAIPWSHQLVDTDGKLMSCCFIDDHHGHVSTMDQDWNNQKMKDLRRALVSGERPGACHRCWRVEDQGMPSHRNHRTATWFRYEPDAEGIVDRSLDRDYEVEEAPSYLEVRLGNLCNLKCKMCWPKSSSQLVKDAKQLLKLDPERYRKYHGGEEHLLDLSFDWYEDPEAWAQIDAIMPYMKRMSFTGGEPTMIKQYIPFLQKVVDQGYAQDILLDFSTNLTNISDDLVRALSGFKSTTISFSVDATGSVYEYIRYPAKWDTIRSNMIDLLERTRGTNVQCKINLVVQSYNILTLPAHLEQLIEINETHNDKHDGFRINLSLAHTAPRNTISHLPQSIRAIALERIKTWRTNNADLSEEFDRIFHNGSLDVIESRLQPDAGDPVDAAVILDYASFIDLNKKLCMEEALPEFYGLLIGESR